MPTLLRIFTFSPAFHRPICSVITRLTNSCVRKKQVHYAGHQNSAAIVIDGTKEKQYGPYMQPTEPNAVNVC